VHTHAYILIVTPPTHYDLYIIPPRVRGSIVQRYTDPRSSDHRISSISVSPYLFISCLSMSLHVSLLYMYYAPAPYTPSLLGLLPLHLSIHGATLHHIQITSGGRTPEASQDLWDMGYPTSGRSGITTWGSYNGYIFIPVLSTLHTPLQVAPCRLVLRCALRCET